MNGTDLHYATFVQSALALTVPTSGVVSGSAVVVGQSIPSSINSSTDKLNDFLVLQSSSAAYIGAGVGDDTYLLSPSMLPAGLNLTITDGQGNNSLQLADGLIIASSKVASNALQLTLTNGSVISILGADNFTYDAGGNTTAGLNGADLDYATFVQDVLAVTVPTSGVVSGSAVVIGQSSTNVIVLTSGSSIPVTATNDADILSFSPAKAKALTANTQVSIQGFNTSADKLQLDLETALGNTTLTTLNGVEGITVQSDPINDQVVINFGIDANGDPVVLNLVGVTASHVAVSVI